MGTRDRLSCLAALLLLVALLPTVNAERRRGWRFLKSNSRSLECRQEFHDLQSKWLQSPLVVRVRWLPTDEMKPAPETADTPRHFNLSVIVQSVLKSPSGGNLKLSSGSRITVGEFSNVLAKRQRTRQRVMCTPNRLTDGRRGYVFFLTATQDPTYFKHAFLPVKFSTGVLGKFRRVSCTSSVNCPVAPRLIKALPKGLKPDDEAKEISMRFVCRAHGVPLPVVRWLKNGVEVSYSDRIKVQIKKRSQSIVSRLQVKPVEVTDAGNYTCLFSNVMGSANASFEVAAAAILNARSRFPSKMNKMPTSLFICDASNASMCLNHGTCVRDKVDGQPRCLCPENYSGHICEKHTLSIDYEFRA